MPSSSDIKEEKGSECRTSLFALDCPSSSKVNCELRGIGYWADSYILKTGNSR